MKVASITAAVFLTVVCAITGQVAEPTAGKSTLNLVGGEVVVGKVGPVRDGSVSVITDYGPIRVPLEKLTAATKAELGLTGDEVDAAALRARIRELEELVARLREENASLRRGGTGTPVAGLRATPAPSPAPEASGAGYKISSTGKRHNSRCRYFGSAGRMGGANEGVACKICGG